MNSILTQNTQDFDKLASQLSVLNRPEKLKILALLTEEGQKSITDISNELNLNFSTTHKYLGQLERAGLVWSKIIKEDRIKRLFYIKDFDINVNTESIGSVAKLMRKKDKKPIKIITSEGEEGIFDEPIFSRQYLEGGIPKPIVDSGVEYIRKQAYDGITVLELRHIFERFIKERLMTLHNAFKFLDKRYHKKRTYVSILRRLQPEILDMHKDGDIFIKNLREPKLLNYVHDIRGIIIHGLEGKPPENLFELFSQVLEAVKRVSKFSYPVHAFDSLNYFIAPLVNSNKFPTVEFKNFLKKLNSLDIKFYTSIDVGVPKFADSFSAIFREKDFTYSTYNKVAAQIAQELLQILREEKMTNIIPIIKIWQFNKFKEDNLKGLKESIIIDMSPEWQTENASYVGGSRFDCTWRGILRTIRVGEIQNIVINLPRIALKTKSKEKFLTQLDELIKICVECYHDIAELTTGVFLKNSIFFESVEGGHWNYIPITECSYNISITGLNEAIYYLTKKELKDNIGLAKEVLELCNIYIKKYTPVTIRIALKEEASPWIAKRFHFLDSRKNEYIIKNYSPGINCKGLKNPEVLYKYFPGGYSSFVIKNLKAFAQGFD